uniref:DDE-1 domain-containing protein n=1 Tax=Pelodiscus sinensis TaxID=13735 RepID=K7G5U3_PELSI
MACGKRKKVVLSIEQKLEALKRINKGESMLKIASELCVGQVTVGDWKRKRSELEKWCSDRSSIEGLKDRKTMKKCEYEKVSEALFLRFTQQREKGMAIIGPILQEKALSFQKEFNEGELDFTASVGCLIAGKNDRLRQISICGEKLLANQEGFLKFKANFHCLIENEGSSCKQIYNCDERGLNYKMLPSKTLAFRAEASAPGKERVTILACSNTTSNHKLRLTFIGKAKKPSALPIATTALPVSYKNQRNAWMDSAIFRGWFLPSVEQFLNSLNLPRKAILVIDNAPAHPHEDELISGDIRVIFLPPTSLCQPMDQGVLEVLKKKYRCKLLTTLIEVTDDGNGMLDKLRTVNIKDVIYWIAQSWEEIEPQTLARSWRKLLLKDENTQEMVQENCDNLLPLLQQIPGCEKVNDDDDIQKWMEKDEQQELTDHDIIALVNQDDNGNEDDEVEDTNDNDNTERISHSEKVKALEAALAYVEQQGEATASDVILLRHWNNIVLLEEKVKRKGK